MMRTIARFMVIALPILAFALMPSDARAQSYTGNWPFTITDSRYANGTYCLALTDTGKAGWPHSGGASLVPLNGTYPGGFQVIDGLLTVTITVPGGYGTLAFYVYVAHAKDGHIGKGVYDLAYGGYGDSGLLTFGEKNGCSN
jgi:hypothetical protein